MVKGSSNKELKFKFVPEKPQIRDTNNPLLFGHGEIVDSLKSVIRHCPQDQSLTIGLFGDWGSGKSTIAESLRKDLEGESTPVPVVIFDVWKHEGDALRRTFLLELIRQLQCEEYGEKYFPNDYQADEQLTASLQDQNVTVTSEFRFTWKRLWSFIKKAVFKLFIVLIFVLSLLVIAGLIFKFQVPLLFHEYVRVIFDISLGIGRIGLNILSMLAGAGVLALFLDKAVDLSTKTTNQVTRSVNFEKFQDPNQFEGEFRRVLHQLKTRKVVIIFDNLDRVSGDNAVTIISTIKTFLEPVDKEIGDKEVVFIIPCDDRAIQRHLSKVFASNENSQNDVSNYSTEYLRKFFNTTIRIPAFNITELEGYAWTCLISTEIKDFEDKTLSSLITQVFKDNPRQIVQFINTLISNYVLFREREQKDKGIEPGFLSKNTVQLAKYLLMIQKFPEVMEVYRDGFEYDLSFYNKETFEAKIKEAGLNTDASKMFNEFQRFLQMTEHIPIESLEIFFKFRFTDHEQSFPKSSKLVKMMEDNLIKRLVSEESRHSESKEIEENQNYIKTLELDKKSGILGDLIKDKLREKQRNNSVDVCKFLNGVFYLTKYTGVTLEDSVYQYISGLISGSDVRKHLHYIDSEILSSEFMRKYQSIRKDIKRKIIEQWANIAFDQIGNE